MTSDERREVAARLRWLASKQGTYKGVLGSDVLVPLRLLSVDYPGFMPRKSVAHLADLIDPTCEDLASVYPSDGFICSACGWPGGTWQAGDNGWQEPVFDEQMEFAPRYCPYCGARVVRPNGE